MIQTKQAGTITLLTATEGLLHKKGTEVYTTACPLMPGETVDMYEEVSEKPPYTESAYKVLVAQLVHERYSADDETSLINNILEDEPSAEHLEEYRAYQAFRAECKIRAKEKVGVELKISQCFEKLKSPYNSTS